MFAPSDPVDASSLYEIGQCLELTASTLWPGPVEPIPLAIVLAIMVGLAIWAILRRRG